MSNGLSGESSPFLQHGAHQPVDWLPWGEAAFERARTEDRPILLDIGAVWCHWCHVMDRESYENEQTAALINRLFVPVKVDRDERPDVDARYQRAVQLLTQQGGWPLTAFLTPDGEVFYGGTYFPPDDRYGRPSFPRVLTEVARIWREERTRALDAARGIEERLATYAQGELEAGEPSASLLSDATEELARSFDFRYGGFGHAPKFPNAGGLDLLLDEWLDTRTPWLLRMHEETLHAMARGGMYDQLGGGFHRYSTDARWIIPHFEKMAYDNGPLLATYARAFAVTQDDRYRNVCDGIVDHYLALTPELLEQGGFPASQDADLGPDDDGDYWTWTDLELADALEHDVQLVQIARLHWGLDDAGGRMHLDPDRHVLFEAMSAERIARHLSLPLDDVTRAIGRARGHLLAVRGGRPQPFVDRTQYSGWVALVAAGFITAGQYTQRRDALDTGLRAVDRLLRDASEDRGIPHRVGEAGTGELLEDQACLLHALLDAFEATQDEAYLEHARTQADVLWRRFGGKEGGGLRDRAADDVAWARPMERPYLPISDSPTPSGNGLAALSLVRLAELTGDEAIAARAGQLLRTFAGAAARLGSSAATWLRALGWATREPVQVVVVTEGESGRELVDEALATYRPRLSVRRLDAGRVEGAGLPAHLAAMVDATSPRAYVCVGRSCHAPVSTPAALRALLSPARE